MALLTKLSQAVAEAEGLEETSVSWIARHLREAGLISQAGRGRGAAHMNASDAANLLIAVNGAKSAKDSAKSVEIIRALSVGPGAFCNTQSDLLLEACRDEMTFGNALDMLIRSVIPNEKGETILEHELTKQKSHWNHSNIELGFGRPQSSAYISVSIAGPPNVNNPFDVGEKFRSIMFAHYWDDEHIWSQGRGRKDLTVIGGDVLMKIGRTLSI